MTNPVAILRLADWKWACLAGLALLGVAVFVVFVIHPGGFEGQIGWFFGLLPGATIGAHLADMVYKFVPRLEIIVQWLSILGISFLWYFALSYAAIKSYRFVVRTLGR